MGLLRKIVTTGGSKAVVLPQAWLDAMERKLNRPIEEVEIDITDEIVIRVAEPRKGSNPEGSA